MGHERLIRYEERPARPQARLRSEPFHTYTFDDGTVWTEFHRTRNGYLLRFPLLADFAVSADGSEVTAWPCGDTDEVTLEHLFVNQLVPLALSRQGRPAFHASVVAIAGGAPAFLGRTGAGKSTLAASFALSGSEFLTDDALLLEESSGDWHVQPSHASLRLWEDSTEALIEEPTRQAAPVSYSSKARLLAGGALRFRETPTKLVVAYELGAADVRETRIESLSGTERYRAWLENSFLLDIEDKDLLAQHFDWTHRVADSVATFRLDYPRDYGMLPHVRDAIRRHVESLDD